MSNSYYFIDPEFNRFNPMYGDGQLYNDFDDNSTNSFNEPEWLNDFPEDDYYNSLQTYKDDNTYHDFSDDEYLYSHSDLE